MLTKEERSAIANRVEDCERFDIRDFYEAVTGEKVPDITTYEQDTDTLCEKIIDLCDTSNMIELPLDKDGEVIRAGDTVYDKDGDVAEVGGYYYNNGTCKIIIPYGQNGCYINVHPNEITHKKPVTIASLVKELTDIVATDYGTPMVVKRKLSDIANQLEKLGDSDD